MDDALSHYLRALADPEIPVSLSAVERLMKDYPFFTLPALTLMQREGSALPAETRRKLLEHIALNAPDPAAFAALSDPERDTWTDFYPAERKAPVTTENVIDTFLATYGHSSPQEDALLERLIFHPTADYSMLLAREEQEVSEPQSTVADDPQDALINSFLLKYGDSSENETLSVPEVVQAAPDVTAEVTGDDPVDDEVTAECDPRPADSVGPDVDAADTVASDEPDVAAPVDHPVGISEVATDTSLSESLAKIYIRRKRYDKAFEIIHGLSLNNPKKSVYFADQLRFLRKLMLNSSLKEKNKPSN